MKRQLVFVWRNTSRQLSKLLIRVYWNYPSDIRVVTRAHASSRYCFWRRLYVCLSVRTKSRKLQVGNRCNLVSHAERWHLTLTFDLGRYFRLFSFAVHMSSAIGSFECLSIATSLSVWRYIVRISRSPLSFKVIGLISRSQQRKSGREQVCAPSNTI